MALVHLFRDNAVRLVFFVLCLTAMAAFGSQKASAQTNGWSICNQTSMIIETSTGRYAGSEVIVEGWIRVRPGECRVVQPAPLTPGPYFLFGRSSKAYRNGTREWTGDYEFCVDAQGSFSVESPPDCVAMGLEARNFQPIWIESKNKWTTTLKETQKWTMATARAAGIQRLLNDAGVSSSNVDGYIGRRTRQGIANFLKAQKLPANTNDNQLMDYLEQFAIDRARNLGLTVCNRTENRVWTAIARRRGEGWESRGWWPIDAGACERTIDDALLSAPHYVFAEMDTDVGRKHLTNATETFCTTRSLFAILGKDECEKNYYNTEAFVETETPEDGRLVFELFDRDFEYAEQPEDVLER